MASTPTMTELNGVHPCTLSLATEPLDTGQLDEDVLDTGQLAVTFHEIHRIDPQEQGGNELVTSTLKYFSLHVAVQNEFEELRFHLDGTSLVASLVYENGEVVEELSVTKEPPLLATAGECPPRATIEGGTAQFRLRITVLSSLCGKQNFAVRVKSVSHPELTVQTAAVKTITKLHRTVRPTRDAVEKRASAPTALVERRSTPAKENAPLSVSPGTCGAKRALEPMAMVDFGCLAALSQCEVDESMFACYVDDALSNHTLDELWDQVSQNGAKLLELQAQQRKLFKELRALKQDEAQVARARA